MGRPPSFWFSAHDYTPSWYSVITKWLAMFHGKSSHFYGWLWRMVAADSDFEGRKAS
jgi:hypothetical protein